MSLAVSLLLVFAGFVVSWVFVRAVRRYALAAEVVDLPNDRTLHEGSVPRGGGLAIVLVFVGAVIAASIAGSLDTALASMLVAVGLLLGLLGWADDHYDLAVTARMLVQFIAAGIVVVIAGPVTSVEVGPGLELGLGWFAVPATVLAIVWMANLYNFMDGIDGIAALQAIIAALALALWFILAGEADLGAVCLLIAGASAGFIAWNWSPARIFMGDVGSLALGGIFAALSVVAVTRYDMPVLAVFTLFLVFIGDATVTLVRRTVRREKIWQAHRSHYYQRAVQAGMTHGSVASVAGLLGVVQAVLATLVIQGQLEPWAGFAPGLAVLLAAGFAVHRLESRTG